MTAVKSRANDIRRVRRPRGDSCCDHLVVALLWVAYQANLGTLLRTCDAAGACIAMPDTDHYHQALSVGDSRRLRERTCIHWLNTGKDRWVRRRAKQAGGSWSSSWRTAPSPCPASAGA